MEHINKDFVGWFSFERFYSDMIKLMPMTFQCVEVGTYKGKSFAYLVVECINSKKNFRAVGVDAFPWEDVEPDFDRNMKPLEGYYNKIKGESSEAASQFNDGELDLVFIDANHTYEFVKRDILAWLPKIKKGGIIAGHDYGRDDYRPYPGVQQAAREVFGDKVNEDYVKTDDVWYVVI